MTLSAWHVGKGGAALHAYGVSVHMNSRGYN